MKADQKSVRAGTASPVPAFVPKGTKTPQKHAVAVNNPGKRLHNRGLCLLDSKIFHYHRKLEI